MATGMPCSGPTKVPVAGKYASCARAVPGRQAFRVGVGESVFERLPRCERHIGVDLAGVLDRLMSPNIRRCGIDVAFDAGAVIGSMRLK